MPGVRAARRGGAAAWAWAALAMMVGAAAPVARGEVGAHELWGFGRNSQGQLGLVDLADHTTPVVLSVLKGKTVLSAAGGGSEHVDGHLAVVVDGGKLYVSGDNT